MEISAKKSLGQNFLKDEQVLQNIAQTLSPDLNDLILEIGPGQGALTKHLLLKGCHYLGYEIDKRMISILKNITSNVIFDDFLSRDLSLDLKDIVYQNLYVVANIPYYITTPIIEHLISSQLNFEKIVLLVQKEVAERFCAEVHSKQYGFFTVYLNYYFSVSKLFEVSRNCFQPVPNVDSAVVCFEKKDTPVIDTKKYFSFLKICFGNKRKTLKNNLKSYDWDKIEKFLESESLSTNVRAEEISSQQFLKLFEVLNS